MDEFEVFDKYHSRSVKELFVTIQRRGNFSLNRAAFQALGGPQSVEILFNRAKRLIGFRPTDPDNGRAVPVRKQSNADSYMIAGLTFTKEYDIDTTVARRYAAKMQENMLVVDLNSPSTDATGPRLRNDDLSQRQGELFSQPSQLTDAQDVVSDGDTTEPTRPADEPEMQTTTNTGNADTLANALTQLDEAQKRAILEILSRGMNPGTK